MQQEHGVQDAQEQARLGLSRSKLKRQGISRRRRLGLSGSRHWGDRRSEALFWIAHFFAGAGASAGADAGVGAGAGAVAGAGADTGAGAGAGVNATAANQGISNFEMLTFLQFNERKVKAKN